ncbi:MAG TPA: hypothetical protein VK935_06365 [Actinomycetospora sp.]|nr:hypothetical protein [Actinomycetospora sp.]
MGVITAGMGRELAAAYGDVAGGGWRVAVTGDTGALVAALVTRHRPADALATVQEPRIEGAPRPVVEVHVSESQLDQVRAADHPGWARLLADLQHQLDLWRAARSEDRAAREAERRAAAHPVACDGHLGAEAWARVAHRRRERVREALARFPSVALRRWITMRDRSCVFPPCGASALAAEIDHTRAVVERGLTAPENLVPVCGHDHDLKDQGWTLAQPGPAGSSGPAPPATPTHAHPRPWPTTCPTPDHRPSRRAPNPTATPTTARSGTTSPDRPRSARPRHPARRPRPCRTPTHRPSDGDGS